jgi:hypothetical protein
MHLHGNNGYAATSMQNQYHVEMGIDLKLVSIIIRYMSQSHASALNNSLEVNTPGWREPSFCGPNCNAAL